MRTLIPVDSDYSLARDAESNAILATDKTKLHRYKTQQSILNEKENKLNILNDRISALENLITNSLNKNEKS